VYDENLKNINTKVLDNRLLQNNTLE